MDHLTTRLTKVTGQLKQSFKLKEFTAISKRKRKVVLIQHLRIITIKLDLKVQIAYSLVVRRARFRVTSLHSPTAPSNPVRSVSQRLSLASKTDRNMSKAIVNQLKSIICKLKLSTTELIKILNLKWRGHSSQVLQATTDGPKQHRYKAL